MKSTSTQSTYIDIYPFLEILEQPLLGLLLRFGRCFGSSNVSAILQISLDFDRRPLTIRTRIPKKGRDVNWDSVVSGPRMLLELGMLGMLGERKICSKP